MIFPCTKCGACCKNIAGVEELETYDLGNGVCKYLDLKNNECKIYATRPNICKIDYMYEKHYAKYYSKKQFYILNIEACKSLQEKEGVEENLKFTKETICHYHYL